jgi:hypothetical protein
MEELLTCVCASCKKSFYLVGDEDGLLLKQGSDCSYVHINSCDSGGVYAVWIPCPHCGNRHDLL